MSEKLVGHWKAHLTGTIKQAFENLQNSLRLALSFWVIAEADPRVNVEGGTHGCDQQSLLRFPNVRRGAMGYLLSGPGTGEVLCWFDDLDRFLFPIRSQGHHDCHVSYLTIQQLGRGSQGSAGLILQVARQTVVPSVLDLDNQKRHLTSG